MDDATFQGETLGRLASIEGKVDAIKTALDTHERHDDERFGNVSVALRELQAADASVQQRALTVLEARAHLAEQRLEKRDDTSGERQYAWVRSVVLLVVAAALGALMTRLGG